MKNLPSSAGDADSISGLGTKVPRAEGQPEGPLQLKTAPVLATESRLTGNEDPKPPKKKSYKCTVCVNIQPFPPT